MTPAEPAFEVSEGTRDELSRAFRELRPGLVELADVSARLDPASLAPSLSEGELEQFLNAYEALFMEALDGSGRQTREFLLETALPPIVARGRSAADMVRSNVISAVMLTHRLLPRVRDDRRDEAAMWLAAFYASYTVDVLDRVLALEAERS